MGKWGDRIIIGILLAAVAFTYGFYYRMIWLGEGNLTVLQYFIGFCIVFLPALSCFHNIKCILRKQKIKADFLLLDSMDDKEFYAYFGWKREVGDSKHLCIAKFSADGEVFREILSISRLYGIVPGNSGYLYVVVHKIGPKKECQVTTVKTLVGNYLFGIPCLLASVGWIVLFLCRGI